MARKALLARVIKRSKEEGEQIPHPVRVAVIPENQWDGKWFDVTLSSDGETIAIASFRRIKDARLPEADYRGIEDTGG
jgi:anti-sigma factor ChrR (cupin superfamily)